MASRGKTAAVREREELAERLKRASLGDRDAKYRYLGLAARADEEAAAHEQQAEALRSSAGADADADDLDYHDRAAARLRKEARRLRGCARESSQSCGRNLAERRRVLGRRPCVWELRAAERQAAARQPAPMAEAV